MKPEECISPTAAESAGSRSFAANGIRGSKALTLRLEGVRLGNAVVLHCEGRCIFRTDAHTVANVISEVLPMARQMVVDLSEVVSFDSGALGELVLTQMWANAAGYALLFASPSDSVRRLLESTNLVSVFDVFFSVDDAIAAMHPEEVHSA
ncbi:MAG: STAS domain-containing protein [Terriglobales bacterium]|jgi:anti-anti-sigma factor